MPESPIRSALRQRRGEADLSQSELARRVGVSRQALIAIEAGRQVPSTTLALQLARALRCSVEDLFTLERPARLEARWAGAAEGERGRVLLGRVDGEWAAHPLSDPTHPGDGIVAAGAPGELVSVQPLTDLERLEDNVLVAGCAPLLGMLTGRVAERYADARATWVRANSTRALDLLDAGLVHAAGIHLVDASAPEGHAPLVEARFPEGRFSIVNLTRWRQGLVVAPGNPLGIRGIEDVSREDVRFARREEGAGAHQLLVRLLAESGVDECSWVEGPLASGHAEVSRLVRWGVADVGVAIESAALAEGLHFIPLAEERFDLVVPRARLQRAEVARLLGLLDQASFRAEASRLPGYDVSSAGHAAEVFPG